MDAPCFSSSSITLILFFLQAMWSGVKPFYRERKGDSGGFYSNLLMKICDRRVNKALFLDKWKHVALAAQCLADLSFYSFLFSSFFPHKVQGHARSVTITSEHDSIHCALCQKRLFTDRHGPVQKQIMLHVITFPPSAHILNLEGTI